MNSPTFHLPAQDAGSPEHGEHSEVCQRCVSDVIVVFKTLACREKMKTPHSSQRRPRDQKQRVQLEDPPTAIREMTIRLKSIQSDSTKADVKDVRCFLTV